MANGLVSTGLWRLDVTLPRPVPFAPGQFAMINLTGPGQLVFRRPFSILGVDGTTISFLYRVVGRGTGAMAGLRPGDRLDCLAPLGVPFPEPGDAPVVILAGGVGLPPLHAWFLTHGRPDDVACFGARDGGDVPWDLLDGRWHVSVDHHDNLPAGREAHHGLVTEAALAALGQLSGPRHVLACGPTPLLRAAADLARRHRWTCHVSLEEHMGCGYGVCKGCVVPVISDLEPGWRNATSCVEGPVFDAADLDWQRIGASDPEVR